MTRKWKTLLKYKYVDTEQDLGPLGQLLTVLGADSDEKISVPNRTYV